MSTITTRAGKGSPLTNNEVDANFTNLNTDKAELSGAAFTGNITFTDNSKAIFGAGSDLQIYHDGSNSYVKDAGTGYLILGGQDTGVSLQNGSGQNLLLTGANAITLSYGSSAKLATTSTGIDVTGIATLDGLVVEPTSATGLTYAADGTNSYINFEANSISDSVQLYAGQSSGGYFSIGTKNSGGTLAERMRITDSGVGIGTSSPAAPLDLVSSSGTVGAYIRGRSSDNSGSLYFTSNSSVSTEYGYVQGRSTDLRIQGFNNGLILQPTSGNVGIGTTAPSAKMHVIGDIATSTRVATDTINGYTGGSTPLTIQTGGSQNIILGTNGSERMRIDSAGNVGIGTASPSSYFSPQLVVHSSVNLGGITIRSNATTDTNYLLFADGTSGNERYRGYVSYDHNTDTMKLATGASLAITIDSSQNVGIGNSSPSTFNQRVNAPHLVVGAGSNAAGLTLYSGTSNQASINFAVGTTTTQQYDGGIVYHPSKYMGFHTNNGAERVRISSAGHTTFGTTDLTPAYNAVNGTSILSDGRINHNAQSQAALTVGRTGTDGAIADFRKSGAVVGTIGVNTSGLYIADAGVGFRFDSGGTDDIIPCNATGGAADASINLGSSGARFNDLYLSGSVLAASPLLVGISSAAGVGGSPSDTNSAEVGAGYINLNRDDLAHATQIQFGKNGAVAGRIHTDDRLSIGTSSTGLYFYNSGNSILPYDNSAATPVTRDDAIDLGSSGARFQDLYLSGGIYLGGTGAANKLDDYEEGTFTPTVIGSITAGTATYNHQKGVYTKIGNVVTVQIYLNWTGGTGAGNLRFSNLPFTSYSSSGYYPSAVIGEHSNISGTAGHTLCGLGLPNTVDIQFAESDFNSAPSVIAYDALGYIILSMTYITA